MCGVGSLASHIDFQCVESLLVPLFSWFMSADPCLDDCPICTFNATPCALASCCMWVPYPHLAAVEWLAASVATFSIQCVLWGDESWLHVHLMPRRPKRRIQQRRS